MITKEQWRVFIDHPVVEWILFGVGLLLILVSPLVGAIPGPGGVIVFGVGLALILKTSMWAKRYYVRFKRKQPKVGRWMDWGLRRRSLRRREQQKQPQEASAAAVSSVDDRSLKTNLAVRAPEQPDPSSTSN
jgi:hypothetical protein